MNSPNSIRETCILLFSHKNIFQKITQVISYERKVTTLTIPSQVSPQFEYQKNKYLPLASSKNSAFTSMAFDAFTSQDMSRSLV